VVQYKQSGGQVCVFTSVVLVLSNHCLCSLTFRWLAVPFFQKELDGYVKIHNTTRRRANKHKILPHGIPEYMFRHPASVGAYDFKVGSVGISIIDLELMSG
jgi:hypothetical protein